MWQSRTNINDPSFRCLCTGCSLNIVFFFLIFLFFWILPVLLQRCCPTCLVCVHCTHTDTEGKQRKTRLRNTFKSWKKNTIFRFASYAKLIGATTAATINFVIISIFELIYPRYLTLLTRMPPSLPLLLLTDVRNYGRTVDILLKGRSCGFKGWWLEGYKF